MVVLAEALPKARAQGTKKTELADKLGISLRTVYHWIETQQLDRDLDDETVRYKARPPVAKKLDGYRGIIEARLTEFPRLSAQRLFDEVRAAATPAATRS